MALINCPECSRQISDQAEACPHCGLPLRKAIDPPKLATPPIPPAWTTPAAASTPPPISSPSQQKKHGAGILILGFITLFAVATCWNASHNSGSTSTPRASTTQTTAIKGSEEEQRRHVAIMDDATESSALRLYSAKFLLKNFPHSQDAERAQKLVDELEEQIRKENIGKQWTYLSREDSMSGKTFYTASVKSTNSFEFSFPYTGRQNATLQIRRHPRWGNDIIFSIEQGQILCSTYGDCRVRVRFDNEQPRTLKGNEPSDNSSETVFIPGYNNFVQKLAKSKTIRIEVDIFQQGPLVAEFNVEGFSPDKLKESKPRTTIQQDTTASNPPASIHNTSRAIDHQATSTETASKDSMASIDIASKNMNPPRYPSDAARAGIEGTTTLAIDVDSNGQIANIAIQKSSHNLDLDRAAIDAAHSWRFNPGRASGKAIAGTVIVPVQFSLGDQE